MIKEGQFCNLDRVVYLGCLFATCVLISVSIEAGVVGHAYRSMHPHRFPCLPLERWALILLTRTPTLNETVVDEWLVKFPNGLFQC